MRYTIERTKELNTFDYFSSKPGLASAIARVEEKTGIKIPTRFREIAMPLYTYGSLSIVIGKIGPYFYFGLSKNKSDWEYEAFENKQKFKLFFSTEGIDAEIAAFFRREIEEIPNLA